MATLNKSAIDTIVESNINSIVANTNPNDVLFAAFSAGQLGLGRCSVQTSADLPDPRNLGEPVPFQNIDSYTTPGTYSWTAPSGVTSVSVIAVGGGGAGGAAYWSGGGGGGGGLGYKSNISVTPGSSYTVVVGAGGVAVTAAAGGIGGNGANSYFIDTSTVAGLGGTGGQGTSTTTNAAYAGGAGGGYVGDSGGNGGTGGTSLNDIAGGGGGAGGYSGNGGAGGTNGAGTSGSGGGGGGAGSGGSNGSNGAAASGGGVGIQGAGASGAGGASAQPGGGGSGGTAGSADSTTGGSGNTGGLYGGGGGGQSNDAQTTPGCNGGGGAVAILYGVSLEVETPIGEGTIVYVDKINIPVILSKCRWMSLDGRMFSGDAYQLWAWGDNGCGRLGDNTTSSRSSPVREVSSSISWCDVSAASNHSAALKSDGTIWSWGRNQCGALGDGTVTDRSSQVREISSSTNWCAVSAGTCGCHSLAIKTDGTLWAWGHALYGKLGDGTAQSKCSPVREASSSTNWCTISAGDAHSAAIKTDGTLWAWGSGACGSLGDNTTVNKTSPVRETTSSTTWCRVSTGLYHSAAIKTDGTFWAWGWANRGQLGDGTVVDKSSPVREITSSTTWCAISTGRFNSAAIKTDGTLWAWGSNTCGGIGDRTTLDKSSPVREISSSTNWCDVSFGREHSAAIKTDGTLWTWGRNSNGELGDNTTTLRSSPVREISSSTTWSLVSSGNNHKAAIKTEFFQAL